MLFPNYKPEAPEILVTPSILAADPAALGRDVAMVSQACNALHIDVMDAHFVPNLSFGPATVAAIKKYSDKAFDVHLMMDNPGDYIEAFALAGADLLTVHVEACTHLHRIVQRIRALDVAVGVSLNPATPLQSLEEILPYVDLVLVMCVNPGFGGQSYIPTMTDKVRRLRDMIERSGHPVHIQVDGGITPDNAAEVVAAGANVLVAGSAVFNAADPLAVIHRLKNCRG